MKKLILLSALLIFACSSDSEGNDCIYEPTLETNAVTDITETSATLNGVISILSENCEVALGEMQGFVYSTNPSPTNDDNVEVVYGTDINTTIDNLTPNTTYYVRVFITNSLGEFYGNEISFTTTYTPCDVVYLDDNGVTIKACPNSNVGDVGTVNGVEYTVVDREMLDQMLLNEEDVTKVCTTLISDMTFLFYENNFNQDISSWDVSNVTDMNYLFFGAETFNQPIGSWDVSNVINMDKMFSNSQFNQDIGSWDVSNVTDMREMFFNTPFNQDIGSWNVGNVIDMRYMFSHTSSFNQDIGNWDVNNVLNCTGFSTNTPQWTLPQPNFTNCNPN